MTRPVKARRASRPARKTYLITALSACLVAGVALTVHGRVLGHPFIQDDWYYLDRVLSEDLFSLLVEEFSPPEKHPYRPLWPLYFFGLAKVFGVLGWLGGIMYAGASSVHMDPLLWASGIFENASVLLALLALWFFLKDRTALSAAAYGGGLLFEESVMFLPLVFAAIDVVQRTAGQSASVSRQWYLRRWSPICMVMVTYAGIKLAGTSPLTVPDNEPYAVRLTGPHIARNLWTYSRWSFEALYPSDVPISRGTTGWLIAGIVALLVVGVGRRLRTATGVMRYRASFPLAMWLIGAMAIPLVLPNQVYRYYLTSGLPALCGLSCSACGQSPTWCWLHVD